MNDHTTNDAAELAARAAKATGRRLFLNDQGKVSGSKVAANLILPGAGALFSGKTKPEPVETTPAPASDPSSGWRTPDTEPPRAALVYHNMGPLSADGALRCARCGCTTFRQDGKSITKVAWGVWAKKHLFCANCGLQVKEGKR